MIVAFDVVGIPAPQGSKRAFVRKTADGNHRAVLVESSHKVGPWRDTVATVVAGLGGVPYDEPVAVRLDFWLPSPQSDPYRTRCDRQPDLDKLVRSTLDAMTMGGMFVDDARVCEIRATKRYAQPGQLPGVHVEVLRLGDLEASDRETLKAAARTAKGGGT